MPQFDVAAAKKAGYTEAQIADFLASEKGFDASAAREAGYDDAQLVSHLSAGEPAVKASDDMGYDPKTMIGRGPRSANNGSGNPEDVREPTAFRGYDPTAMEDKVTREGLDKPTVMGGDLLDKSWEGAAARTVAEGLAPTTASLVGSRLGMIAGAPAGPWGAGAGALAGGLSGGWLGKTVQDALLRAYPETAVKVGLDETQRQVDATQHPVVVPMAAAGLGFLSGRPGRTTNYLEPVISGAIGGTFEAANEVMSGQKLNPAAIAGVSGLSALQYKPHTLSNMASSRISDLENMLIRSRGVDPNEARQIAADMLTAGTPAVPADLFSAKNKADFGKVTELAPKGHELAAKYAEGVLADVPKAGQKVVSQLAPSDVRTAEQAAAEAAKDIAEHPDVIAAKPDVVSGEAGSKIHETFNADLDARESNMSATYKKAEEGGKTVINPSVATPADLSSRLKAAFDPHAEIFGEIDLPASARRFTKMSSFLTDANELDVGQIFKMRKQLNSVIGGKPGSPDAAAAKDMKKVLDGFMDEVVDAPDGLVGDPNTVNDWRSAIGQRREIGQLYQANDVMQDITEREFSGGKKVPKMGADFVSKRLLGNLTGTKDQVKDLTALRDRLGENDPKWVALQKEGLAKVLGKDFGTKNFGAALKKFESDNPALAKLFITDEDRIRLTKGQDVVQGAIGRQGAQSAASNIMSTNPTDFANSVSAMSRSALRDARVAARQVLRDAMNNPAKSESTLRQIVSQPDSQDNIIALFGEDEGGQLIRSAKAVTGKIKGAIDILPKDPKESGAENKDLAKAIALVPFGAKMGPGIAVGRFLENLGMRTTKANQIVADALDPSKTDEVIAMIEKNYGKSTASRFAKRVANVMATQDKKPLIVNKATAISSVTRPEPKETKPEEKVKEPQASTSANYDVGYLASKIESHEGLGKNPTSSAVGPFQFVSGTLAETYNQMHPDQDPITPEQADAMRSSGKITEDDLREMGKFHTQKNIDFLLENDLPITASNVYLMHFAGRGATPKVIAAEPTAPITDVLSADQIAANSNIEFEGKRFPEFTVQDLRDWANDVML